MYMYMYMYMYRCMYIQEGTCMYTHVCEHSMSIYMYMYMCIVHVHVHVISRLTLGYIKPVRPEQLVHTRR